MGDIHGSAASPLTRTADFGVGGLEKLPCCTSATGNNFFKLRAMMTILKVRNNSKDGSGSSISESSQGR